MFLCLFFFPTGLSDQMGIDQDRVVFNSTVTFTADGLTEQTVSATIPNDMIAPENDEIVNVSLTIVSPASGVNLGQYQTTLVTIVYDDNGKFSEV